MQQIKATATPTPQHADSLVRFCSMAGGDVHGALACQVERVGPLRPGIRAVPWQLLFD
ncbi:MAG: hypothetical protein JXR96_02855 [Deltaproteobacteria bacterium]|nr:hypothetical protein [Deltaproteobacteria bacterium]